ncbi:ABSCISIC ACID-INSENSITIVE 5-like protein 5 [Macadamia integrifolia]|uniref:ABSCISIC ACID-INSENSITIVE 5-like protein 5 n=1 Tax=Macadamia integrifolia TaxID=60698 RepID=UPI001C4F8418|nr:ABSCISIC ACID-INSENSITIVE 5-like protein 5 [Macadamia integrifolia]
MAYVPPLHLANSARLGSPGVRGRVVGITDPGVNHGFVPGGGMGVVGLRAGAVSVASGFPDNQLSTDGPARSNGDTSSLSPIPYAFNGGFRGRKCSGAVEKVVERRQRRMIKNRESAARSRARKQAYTMELEAEVAKLKEENQKLQQKQAEIIEMQKNQGMQIMKMHIGQDTSQVGQPSKDSLLASIAETEQQSKLTAWVSLWKQRIEQNLEVQDSHTI